MTPEQELDIALDSYERLALGILDALGLDPNDWDYEGYEADLPAAVEAMRAGLVAEAARLRAALDHISTGWPENYREYARAALAPPAGEG